MGYVIGVDIGGTFTDCTVLTPDGQVVIGKASSTPPNFENGFVDATGSAARRMGMDLTDLIAAADGIYHGCTVGTNALVQNRVARVGLLTTRGHGDTTYMMQAGRRLINMPADVIAHVAAHTKPAPLVPKHLVVEVPERVTFDGNALVPLTEESARAAVAELLNTNVEAIAISLLWSVSNSEHEELLERVVRELAPDVYVSRSSAVAPRVGEYERTVTTIINAAIGPVMASYVSALASKLENTGFPKAVQIMTCAGGLIDPQQAIDRPVLTIGSGPVAGLIGAQSLASAMTEGSAGFSRNVLTTDMGGTTYDVGVIRDGEPLRRGTSWHGQFEYFAPTLDVRSVGSGGGSLIAYEPGRQTLAVGPESAGAIPGPVCYGRGGTQPTVSDADLILGYLNPAFFLDGEMGLDFVAARQALARVGEPLGFDADQTAAAAIRIVDNQMADAIRLASIGKGYDPRELNMYAYGGAGPLHACAVARELDIRTVVVPLSDLASGWSSFGVASSDAVVVESLGRSMAEPFDPDAIQTVFSELERKAANQLISQGIDASAVLIERYADMKYQLQVNELEVHVPSGRMDAERVLMLIKQFETDYDRLYGEGTGYAAAGFAISGLTVRASAPVSNFSLKELSDKSKTAGADDEPVAQRDILFYGNEGVRVNANIYRGTTLSTGSAVDGPAVIEYPDTTVVLHPGDTASVDDLGNLIITVASRDRDLTHEGL